MVMVGRIPIDFPVGTLDCCDSCDSKFTTLRWPEGSSGKIHFLLMDGGLLIQIPYFINGKYS